jgi:hypothetical protein
MAQKIEERALDSVEQWSAALDEIRRLPPGRSGLTVRVEEGLLLVTQAGDPLDHLLDPGREIRLEGKGLGVAWALQASRVLLVRSRPAAPRPDLPLAA